MAVAASVLEWWAAARKTVRREKTLMALQRLKGAAALPPAWTPDREHG
ncbi:hypothetical protein QWM81_04680 [Streptomyces ficellus]|uniref:Uncharacterized protein n=1 Tax=Streptomyces ficellus TaxID=1977088 RepID=A0ABT7Z1I4_9ACTN|nr:hypothetical protein [Streptomyces ficellus]MDN3293355.1 hypothetical protein [Streptomyces ficellus]